MLDGDGLLGYSVAQRCRDLVRPLLTSFANWKSVAATPNEVVFRLLRKTMLPLPSATATSMAWSLAGIWSKLPSARARTWMIWPGW